MRATSCRYILDFNPAYDKLRTQWERERALAKESPATQRGENVSRVDREFLAALEPILLDDVRAGIVRCKADLEVPLNQNLSLNQIAEAFGITRPRVQQIEARAEKKVAQERLALEDYLMKGDR